MPLFIELIQLVFIMPRDQKEFILKFFKEKGLTQDSISIAPLPGDGSRRSFWRTRFIKEGASFIAMANPPRDRTLRRENYAYLMIGKHLHLKGLPVPEIYLHDLEHGWFILEDMGHTNLQEIVSSTKKPLPIYEKVLEHLLRLQINGAKDFDPAWCCQTKRYDYTVMRRYEAYYFRDAFLFHYLGLKKEWPELDTTFNHLAETASKADSSFFLHRDFQSRNIMVSKGNIGIIDWQGGRFGPLGYDLASLLIDPYVELTRRRVNELYENYLLLIKNFDAGLVDSFKRHFPYLAIQRNLQILGAFSYLTKIMHKGYFDAFIPKAITTLYDLLHQTGDPKLSPLKDLVGDLARVKDKKSLDNNSAGR